MMKIKYFFLGCYTSIKTLFNLKNLHIWNDRYTNSILSCYYWLIFCTKLKSFMKIWLIGECFLLYIGLFVLNCYKYWTLLVLYCLIKQINQATNINTYRDEWVKTEQKHDMHSEKKTVSMIILLKNTWHN